MSAGTPTEPVGRERVGIVMEDDHHLFRAGVRAELMDTCDLVGEANAPAGAVEVQPGVVLLDVHLPDGGGVAVLGGLRAAGVAPPGARAVGVGLRRGRRADDPRRGAGVCDQTIEILELVHALGIVAVGDAYFSPRLAAFVLQAFSVPPLRDSAPGLEDLTPRERKVPHHLARGDAYKQIGVRLGISARTVESHVGAVLRKLQLTSRHEVTHWAVSRGLIASEEPEP